MPSVLINLINRGFEYVVQTSKLYKIDESHALKHSMEVYGFSKKIYESELKNNPILEKQREIIYMAAIGHDMCDKKYMDDIIYKIDTNTDVIDDDADERIKEYELAKKVIFSNMSSCLNVVIVVDVFLN